VDIRTDCDQDTLLLTAWPRGPVCHTGTKTCFGDEPLTTAERLAFLGTLEGVIAQRIADRPEGSYTARLFSQGPKRIAQKVGEEGLEVALAAVAETDDKVIAESADLLFHLLLLLKSRGLPFEQVVAELQSRHAGKP
jgi:phosphoribosyl-ATP pyrophosphohydrolase/phosphoribosyl-AMP cyclohydrolase